MSEGVEAAQLEPTATTSEASVIKGEPTSGVEHQPGVPGQEGKDGEVRPKEMFEAVVEAIKISPLDPPHEAWIATVAELYAIAHDTVTIAAELVPTGKQRFPTLRSEKPILFKFFEEACIISEGSFVKWEQYAQTVTHDLYNTSWSFKNIMQSMISKVKWARAKPLNRWAAKVKSGIEYKGTRHSNTAARGT
ncbi:unnamed protein product [Peronospora destructor]|uniref:Uncharacterized protein n=1 Tax=Peronospora destructor TaxID=86335 RepID=A0AAV0VF74_9STRA|nr:unnamed protein product [Peronospora destructor]